MPTIAQLGNPYPMDGPSHSHDVANIRHDRATDNILITYCGLKILIRADQLYRGGKYVLSEGSGTYRPNESCSNPYSQGCESKKEEEKKSHETPKKKEDLNLCSRLLARK